MSSLRIDYNSSTDTLAKLIGGTISQMYTEYDGKMGFSIHNLNKRVTEIHKNKDKLKIVFGDGSSEVVRQAMIVYAKDEKAGETTEEETDDERTEEAD